MFVHHIFISFNQGYVYILSCHMSTIFVFASFTSLICFKKKKCCFFDMTSFLVILIFSFFSSCSYRKEIFLVMCTAEYDNQLCSSIHPSMVREEMFSLKKRRDISTFTFPRFHFRYRLVFCAPLFSHENYEIFLGCQA